MIRIILAIALAACVTTQVSAQNLDVIKQRKEAFKSFLPHAKAGTAMIKGEADFDLDKAKAIFNAYAEIAKKLPELFPDDSKTGGETEALPVIWEKKDDFTARFASFAKDATDAANSIDDEFAFRDAWPKVMGNCGSCHKVYRVEKK